MLRSLYNLIFELVHYVFGYYNRFKFRQLVTSTLGDLKRNYCSNKEQNGVLFLCNFLYTGHSISCQFCMEMSKITFNFIND